jgi:AcrR family transcriptional regulator
MAKRSDGLKTRDRILKAASEVFAEKGYHDATVEDICRHAQTNVAAINYHFGSKDRLYAEVWRHAFNTAMAAYPPEGGFGPEAPLEQRLRGSIHGMVGRSVDPGRIGRAGRLLLREMVNPTDVIRDVKRDAIQPLHDRMCGLMGQLLGPEAAQDQVLLCAMSVVHQCLMIGRMPVEARLDVPTDQLVEILADHITRFSLAGVMAIRKDLEADRTR